jgi:hypothetical protein
MPEFSQETFDSAVDQFLYIVERIMGTEVIAFVDYLNVFHCGLLACSPFIAHRGVSPQTA